MATISKDELNLLSVVLVKPLKDWWDTVEEIKKLRRNFGKLKSALENTDKGLSKEECGKLLNKLE